MRAAMSSSPSKRGWEGNEDVATPFEAQAATECVRAIPCRQLTWGMCHINVSHMKTANIRELRHDTNTVLGWVAAGEQVSIQRRGKTVAILSAPVAVPALERPDFKARLKQIYGDQVLDVAATEHFREERGDR